MALLNWDEQFATGNTLIDTEHQRLFAFAESLDRAIQEGAATVIGPFLSELLHYTETHFYHEEALMRGFNYPDIVAHQKLHDDLRSRVRAFEVLLANGEAITTELMGLVKEWLQNHIGEEDKRIADHIRKPGTIWDAANSVQLRKHPRYPVSFPLTYILDGNPVVKRGRARDISGGGIHLESDESVPENTSMTISFELRPELNVEVRGRPVVSLVTAAWI